MLAVQAGGQHAQALHGGRVRFCVQRQCPTVRWNVDRADRPLITSTKEATMSRLLGGLTLIFLWLAASHAAAQTLAQDIVGLWQRSETVRTYDGEAAKTIPYSGVVLFTKGGHFITT